MLGSFMQGVPELLTGSSRPNVPDSDGLVVLAAPDPPSNPEMNRSLRWEAWARRSWHDVGPWASAGGGRTAAVARPVASSALCLKPRA